MIRNDPKNKSSRTDQPDSFDSMEPHSLQVHSDEGLEEEDMDSDVLDDEEESEDGDDF
ncbi:MAG: hypothetical protein NVS1B13_13280 [Flavisolibacter sp.]